MSKRRLNSRFDELRYSIPFMKAYDNFAKEFSSFAFSPNDELLFSAASELHGKIRRMYFENKKRVSADKLINILNIATYLIKNRKKILTNDPYYMASLYKFKSIANNLRLVPYGRLTAAAMSGLFGTLLLIAAGVLFAISIGFMPPLALAAGVVITASVWTSGAAAVGLLTGIGGVMTSGMLLFKSATKATLVNHMDRFTSVLTHPQKKFGSRYAKNKHNVMFEDAYTEFASTYISLAHIRGQENLFSAASELNGKIRRLFMEKSNRVPPKTLIEILNLASYLMKNRENSLAPEYRKKLEELTLNTRSLRRIPFGKILAMVIGTFVGTLLIAASGIIGAISLGLAPALPLVFGLVLNMSIATKVAAVGSLLLGEAALMGSGMLLFKSLTRATLVSHLDRFKVAVTNPIMLA